MQHDTAESLWNNLNTQGRFYPKTHDKKLFEALRQSLGIPPGGDISTHLKNEKTDTTTLVIALLTALQPFSQMLNDIYEMLIDGNVTKSNEQILINFDFDESGNLNFDVNAFRVANKLLTSVAAGISSPAISPRGMDEVARGIYKVLADAYIRTTGKRGSGNRPVIGERNAEPVTSVDPVSDRRVLDWMQPEWPYVATVPMPTLTSGDPIDKALRPYINAVSQLSLRAKRYTDQTHLRTAFSEPLRSWDARAPVLLWGENVFARIMDDHPVRFRWLPAIWHCYEFASKNALERKALADQITRVIEGNFELPPPHPVDQSLNNLLDLPIWKERSQIYAVWLITLLRNEVMSKGGRFQLLGMNGSLEFHFSPTPIADVYSKNERFSLISEFKALAPGKLIGTGRLNNVQPDYTLIHPTHSTPDTAVYVLEAKQYDKANTLNFNKALRDYAFTHKKALVALANHGTIPDSQRTKLARLCEAQSDHNVSERCEAFAEITPLNPAESKRLSAHFRKALEFAVSVPPRLILDTSLSMHEFSGPELAEKWTCVAQIIADSGLETLFCCSRSSTVSFSPGEAGKQAMMSLFETAPSSIHDLYNMLGHENQKPMWFTDADGFRETENYQHLLSGILVLNSDFTIDLYIHKDFEIPVNTWFPGLIRTVSKVEIYDAAV
ncbi:hypothetical protein GE543_24895 [Pseudomonas sp. SZ57]|uniref:hypothetical protein n=1 Tax=Pseudomonas sp. SZ57 TaxID=2662259 RepID=UPI0012921B2A|nr:hypothetical protein [Pseudomonas sp. SZ57]MQQ37476.1 hypothetical protein [Pseudomonas sp. SZ57]